MATNERQKPCKPLLMSRLHIKEKRRCAYAPRNLPITLFLDNAPYQRCQMVRDQAKALGLELMFLPSYSPNLNLIERYWRWIKNDV